MAVSSVLFCINSVASSERRSRERYHSNMNPKLVSTVILLSVCFLLVKGDDTEAKALADEIKSNQASSDKLVTSINKFLANKQNVTDDSIGKALKDAAGELWNSGDNLSLSLIKLADFLGVQPPPPEEDHDGST